MVYNNNNNIIIIIIIIIINTIIFAPVKINIWKNKCKMVVYK